MDVFGGGNDYDWALEGEEGLEEEEEPKEIRLEDVSGATLTRSCL